MEDLIMDMFHRGRSMINPNYSTLIKRLIIEINLLYSNNDDCRLSKQFLPLRDKVDTDKTVTLYVTLV